MKPTFSNRPSKHIFLFASLLFPFLLTAQLPWSDPATWGGTLPVAGENVVIPTETHIILDTNTPDLAGLTIHGTLEFDNQDLTLTADWIMVMGRLEVGTETSPYAHQANIILNGNDPTVNMMGMGTRGIMVMGGELELHGVVPATVWTKLSADAPAGSTNISLLETVDWQNNDEIIVSPTDYYLAGGGSSITQKVSINQVTNGQELTINEGLNAYRWGRLQYATTNGMSVTEENLVTPPSDTGFTPTILDERAYVGHLSRNIVVQAPEDSLWTNAGFGFHIMIMRNGGGVGNLGIAHLEGVELRRGGQRGLLGRYPFHWHMLSYHGSTELGDATGQYIRNSTVNESMNRGIVIHGTNGTLVKNNVVYSTRGHGVFTEDASERRNVIDSNLVLHARNPDPGFALKLHETGGRGSSGFWISNPDNTITNNVAGDNNTNGFWLAFPNRTFGLSTQIDIRPNRLRFGVFENNTAFSNQLEGLMLDVPEQDEAGNVFPESYASTTDGQELQWPYDNLRRFTIKGCHIWKNGANGFWDRSTVPSTLEFVSADNCGRFFAGAGAGGLIQRCLAIGTSLNHLMNGTDRPNFTNEVIPSAFATYHSTFDIQDNIAINFSAVEGEMSGVFATNDYYIRPVELGQIRNTNNLVVNAHPGVKMTAQYSYFALAGALWDPHGIWGGNAGDYLVYDSTFFTAGQTPTPVSPSTISGGVLVEGPFYGFNEFVINRGNIRWEDFMAINVQRLDDDFQNIGNWELIDADPSWALSHMRHFATHPSDYYQLEFPSIDTVFDVGINVTAMTSTDDYQVIAIEYTGHYDIEEVYTSTSFHYLEQDNVPTIPTKHNYQAVGSRQAVIDAAEGEVYWQDMVNNLVWIKIRGGITQFWQPDDYDLDSDERIYWPFNLRVRGSEATCANNHELNATPINAGNYRAANNIVSSGIVSAGNTMNFLAGESITLQAGFHAEGGAFFSASIQSCGINTNIIEQTEIATQRNRADSPEHFEKVDLKVFPNPMQYQTNIQFHLPKKMTVNISVFDFSGQLVQTLNNKALSEGCHQLEWQDNRTSGIYFVQLQTEIGQQTVKVIKLKL